MNAGKGATYTMLWLCLVDMLESMVEPDIIEK